MRAIRATVQGFSSLYIFTTWPAYITGACLVIGRWYVPRRHVCMRMRSSKRAQNNTVESPTLWSRHCECVCVYGFKMTLHMLRGATLNIRVVNTTWIWGLDSPNKIEAQIINCYERHSEIKVTLSCPWNDGLFSCWSFTFVITWTNRWEDVGK